MDSASNRLLICTDLFQKGITQGQAGKLEEEITTYDEVVRRFGEAAEPALREQVAKALFNKGVTQGQAGKPEETIATYDEVVRRFGEAAEPVLREQVAKALVNKGVMQGQAGKPEEAIATYDEVVRRFGEAAEPVLREQVAKALVNKGVTQGQAGKLEEKIATYDEVVRRFGEAVEPALRERVAKALVYKGITQGQAGKLEEEIATYDEVVRRFGEAAEPALREQVAKALVNKGIAQGQTGKPEEEIATYDEVVRRFGEAAEPALREQVAKALVYKGVTQGQTGKPEEEIATYDEVVRRFGEAAEPVLREQVAKALVNKGVTQSKTGKPEEAIATYDEVVRRFGEAAELALREQVARALVNKGFVLRQGGKLDDAIKVLRTLDSRQNNTEGQSEAMAKILAFAYSLRTDLLSSETQEETEKVTQLAIQATRTDLSANLSVYLKSVLRRIDQEKQQDYFKRMDLAKEQTDRFLTERSYFNPQSSFLLILRQWNSYTPVIPAEEEADRGGGYFFRHGGEGIVIDPGYDFIDNFYRAGGHLCDIDHIVVTHAHDDHTAELEALLMLLHQYNDHRKDNPKRVSLYLSVGVQRKFAGLLNLRDAKTKRFVSLVWAGAGSEQRIPLNEKTTLYVLPAYHDDVITRDMSVGLGFVLQTTEGERKIAFTGDSGLFPRKCDTAGEPLYYDKEKKQPQLDTDQGKALYEQYPKQFKNPDLLVAHIGSIKRQEFEPPELIGEGKEMGTWYYPNHLGMLGTLTMLHQIKPKAAIISEFGSEMRGFHADLVNHIAQALHERQEDDQRRGGTKSIVIPGDLTVAYDIANHKFLCHDNCKFMKPTELVCRLSRAYKSKLDRAAGRVNVEEISYEETVYLFSKRRRRNGSTEKEQDCQSSRKYYDKFFNHELPYHARLMLKK